MAGLDPGLVAGIGVSSAVLGAFFYCVKRLLRAIAEAHGIDYYRSRLRADARLRDPARASELADEYLELFDEHLADQRLDLAIAYAIEMHRDALQVAYDRAGVSRLRRVADRLIIVQWLACNLAIVVLLITSGWAAILTVSGYYGWFSLGWLAAAAVLMLAAYGLIQIEGRLKVRTQSFGLLEDLTTPRAES